jgi:hypothetical protein
LKRLYCGLYDPLTSNQIDFTHRLFSRLTHLEVIDSRPEMNLETWSGLALIPNLTHLAFNGLYFLSWAPFLLDRCPSLRLLVSLCAELDEAAARIAAYEDAAELLRDLRFVVMDCGEFELDWQTGAHTSEDYWVRAEAFANRRRSGEIDGMSCAPPPLCCTLIFRFGS